MAPLVFVSANSLTRDRLSRHDAAIKRLARVDWHFSPNRRPEERPDRGRWTVICLPLGALIDLGAEKTAAIAKTEAEMRINGKLSNEKFVAERQPGGRRGRTGAPGELTVQLASSNHVACGEAE